MKLSMSWVLRLHAIVLCLALSITIAEASQTSTQQTNATLVREAFTNWQQGKGTVFDLLAPNARWTVAGTSPVSGVYASKAELTQVVRSITARLATPIVPTVQSIVAEDDVVVVLWNGRATALDHKPYNNSYLWHMTFKNGQVVEVTAFLDTYVLDDLMRRVKPARQ
jgi:ketosteroid isomerase-like protein